MAQSQAIAEDREHLVRALEADLIGPFAPDEELELPPSRWYLTGFLAAPDSRAVDDPTSQEELGAGSDESDVDGSNPEPEPKQKHRFPASLGMSVLLPKSATEVRATVHFAQYIPEQRLKDDGKKRHVWKRQAVTPPPLRVPLDARVLGGSGLQLAGADDVWLVGKLGDAHGHGLENTQALSLFVVNRREAGKDGDAQYLFQVQLELECEQGFVRRPNLRDETSKDWDDRVADLQFRQRCEWAVGHGVAIEAPDGPGPVAKLRTTWIPRSEVHKVTTNEHTAAAVAMEELAELKDAATIRKALDPIVDEYGEWLAKQAAIEPGSTRRRETRDELLRKAERARQRVKAGIDRLATDAEAREAFALANRAMALSARQRSPERYVSGGHPEWRLFQLAFVLLNIEPAVNEAAPDRETVELIFFPTGGGKTEAYLGVIAFTLLLRRLRGQTRPDGGLGVAVILRYTLRLLTLDQLGRAATLICALERLRKWDPARLGDQRFAVGLWVGRTATANTLSEVSVKITNYKNSSSGSAASPFPLNRCPWCNKELTRDSLNLLKNVKETTGVVVGCADFRCEFSAAKNPEGLPVLFVDEQVYRELPAFLIATVDKFAMLPWRGETGMLFGRVSSRRGREFFGPLDDAERSVAPLPEGLRPPELIVQDELHLISGPLGTMVGLYETAIETLCTWRGIRPRIMAATATVRRAQAQVKALFGRGDMALFPPPAVDDSESFFATVDTDSPGRLYVGLAAPGRPMKQLLLRAYVALMSAARKRWDKKGPPEQTADAYMTLVGYFNSLRELGGMRRLVDDEVRQRCEGIESRKPLNADSHPWVSNRKLDKDTVELTSRESTGSIAATKAKLSEHYGKNHVDVLLASNMISVGVDIDRLGLMVVAGQPKTTSEYIQASSRVGRQAKYPGLVVTCFNVARPRDRSHYERFAAYHESFYRNVEAMSLTPFSEPALRRGFAGTLLAMARLAEQGLTPPEHARLVAQFRPRLLELLKVLAERSARQPDLTGPALEAREQKVLKRGENLLESWQQLVKVTEQQTGDRTYSRYDREKGGKPILYQVTDADLPERGTDDAKFNAPTSMRDVEPTVHLWLTKRALGGKA